METAEARALPVPGMPTARERWVWVVGKEALQIRVWVGDTQCPEVRDRRQEGWHFPFDTHSGSWTAELIQPLKIAKEFETCSPQPDRPRLRLAHARSHTYTHIPARMNSTTAQSM